MRGLAMHDSVSEHNYATKLKKGDVVWLVVMTNHKHFWSASVFVSLTKLSDWLKRCWQLWLIVHFQRGKKETKQICAKLIYSKCTGHFSASTLCIFLFYLIFFFRMAHFIACFYSIWSFLAINPFYFPNLIGDRE